MTWLLGIVLIFSSTVILADEEQLSIVTLNAMQHYNTTFNYNKQPNGIGIIYNNMVYLNFQNSFHNTIEDTTSRSTFVGYIFDADPLPLLLGLADGYGEHGNDLLPMGGILLEWKIFHTVIAPQFIIVGLKLKLF